MMMMLCCWCCRLESQTSVAVKTNKQKINKKALIRENRETNARLG
jgi:hypothetical protein